MQTTLSIERPRPDSAEFKIEELTGSHQKLHVRGRMPIDWVSNLAGGLARNGLNIERGQAFREGAMAWHGHFVLTGRAQVEEIDFHQLVKTAAPPAETNLVIDNFTLRTTTERGGTLFLDVKGEDQLGFLGTFLGKLSFFSLFPLHLEIETVEGRVLDRFWLTSAGGGPPSDPIIAVLKRALEKMSTAKTSV